MLGTQMRAPSAVVAVSLIIIVPAVLHAQGVGQRPHEDRFVVLAAQIPGFGGFSFDTLGNLHSFVRDTTTAGAARVLLAPILASHPKGRRDRQAQRPQIVIHAGQFDFTTLRSWHDRLSMRVLGIDGAVYTDIAEDRNRIVIGIDRGKASAARSNVQSALAQLGVPPGMVEIVETVGFVIDRMRSTCNPCAPGDTTTGRQSADASSAPTLYGLVPSRRTIGYGPSPNRSPEMVYDPSASTQHTSAATELRDRIRPLEGGIEVDYFNSNNSFYYGCTLGFIAIRSQQRSLITASHCSIKMGTPDGTGYYQPTVEAGNYAGAEIADPGFTGACNDPVNPNIVRPCRGSDALAAAVATEATTALGKIAKPTGTGTFSSTASGSTTVDATQPHFTITAKGTFPDVNMILDKVGFRTGWTYGYVTETCVNVRMIDESDNSVVVLRCQDFVETTAQQGDSGGPVFMWGDTGVTLYGLVSARRESGLGLAMSAMTNIESELGTLTVY